jgi:hypothetical protein
VTTQTVQDYVVIAVPEDASEEELLDSLNNVAHREIMAQYKGRKPVIVLNKIAWLITSSAETMLAYQPDHDCVTCRAAHDQAVAYLREFPQRRLACANIRYIEIWDNQRST